MKLQSKPTLRLGLIVLGSVAVSTFLCIIVTFSFSIILTNLYGQILVQAIDLIIYCSVLYTMVWYEGDRDAFSAAHRGHSIDNMRGVKAGLMAMVVPLLTSLILVFSKLGVTPDLVMLYKAINAQFLVLINLIMPIANIEIIDWSQILYVTLYQFIIPLMTGISYLLGVKHLSVLEKMVYKDKDELKKKRNRFFR